MPGLRGSAPRLRRAALGALISAVVVTAVMGLALGDRLHLPRPGGRSPAYVDASVVPRACDPLPDDVRQRAVCRGVWVHAARRVFVPQGLAFGPGGVAFVSGYHRGRPGTRLCEVLVVDPRTGRTLHRVRELRGSVGTAAPIGCRHGGGLARTSDGLWIAHSRHLWLVDEDALLDGRSVVLRGWRIQAPVRGSALVSRGASVGLVGWSARRPMHVDWLRVADLLAPGVTDVRREAAPASASPYAVRKAPFLVQGATWGPGGLWFASSTTYCGVLHEPGGRTLAFIPGAEGIAFRGRRLWAVSESGSGSYQHQGGRPKVPTLVSLVPRRLDPRTRPGCSWLSG
ncbi:MAG: hypothetical protein U0R80_16665 [Nocardioidaceae bacterium]